ncbi:germ cell-less isoform X1 [Cotesia typhae]|uniref:germ cell-less isoform X1 n=1 Tax=Cotesia typhae TaxID=2053667 RepID=UPI003D68EC4A
MGGYVSKIASMSNIAVNTVYRGRKRKCIEEDDCDSDSEFIDRTLQTPKKRKLLTTAQYIYKTLFQEEKGSDITVYMLGRPWRLHKVYISQSPYFASMFSGSWKETNQKFVPVEITDSNISLDSLSIVLGSFYQDEVSIEPKNVISILATSTLFQLQGLIDQCTEIMIETTNIKTVVPYYNAAVSYGVPTVKAAAKRWLEVNLLGYGSRYPSFLKEITPELMVELIKSSELVAIQTEFCIYMMLRVWLFIHMQNKEDTEVDEYFKKHAWTKALFETAEGKEFAEPFRALRMKYLLLHDQDVKILNSDNLIPAEWLHDAYKEQWLHLLRIDADKDADCGLLDNVLSISALYPFQAIVFRPKQMDEEEFAQECFRCGRCIEKPGEHIWRWTAFQFGLDLVVYLDTSSLGIRRNNRTDANHISANHSKRNIIIRVCLFSLNEQRQIKHYQNSGVLRLTLHKNEEKQVMSLDKQLTYPLYISVNIQVVTPFTKSEEEEKPSGIATLKTT